MTKPVRILRFLREIFSPMASTEQTLKRPLDAAVVNSKRSAVESGLEAGDEAEVQKEARRPKRKVGVLIGYCGTGYHGMQLNPPHKTIESELFEAFVKAGAISKDNANDPKKSSLIRAARTDKGVHAAGNVVSLKLIVEDEDIVEKINSHLPEQIRVWGYQRTNKSFECRKCCSSRVYEYILPTYTLMAPKPSTQLGHRLETIEDRVVPDELKTEAQEFWDAVDESLREVGISEDDMTAIQKQEAEKDLSKKDNETELPPGESSSPTERKSRTMKQIENKHRRAYRAATMRIEQLQKALREYEGVHNFHNYTVGKGFKDPSAIRVMKSLEVSDPKIINGTEWVSIKIHGQSFMLHQIRKMIAMAVLTVRMGVPSSRLSGLYESTKVGIPKAPALGLLLEQPKYDAYNQRLAKLGREDITFEAYEREMEEFKHKYIYDRIYEQEAKENEFHAFFAFIDTYRVSGLLDYLSGKPLESIDAQDESGPDADGNEGSGGDDEDEEE